MLEKGAIMKWDSYMEEYRKKIIGEDTYVNGKKIVYADWAGSGRFYSDIENEILKIENLSKSYLMGDGEVQALKDVSFSLNKGEIVAIMGSSGSGKSTLLNILGALDSPDSGKVYLDGVLQKEYHIEPFATQYRSEKIGFIFQSFNLLKDLTVEDNIALPLLLQGIKKEEVNNRVNDILEKLKLTERREHRPAELSGGQRQRVSIARAVITNPEILLADEPTGNLDYNTSLEILEVITDMRDKLEQTIIIVTHDPLVASYANRILFFKDGGIKGQYIQNEKDRDIDKVLLKFKEILKGEGKDD